MTDAGSPEPDRDGAMGSRHDVDEPGPGQPATPGEAFASAFPSVDNAALAALMGRILIQDEQAMTELYRHLATRVFRQVSRWVRDTATAEEVVEEVFWQIWRQAPRFDPERGAVIAWVLQMTRSRALDALRAQGRHPLFAALDLEDDSGMPVAEDADPQTLLERARLSEQVNDALALLDPLRRQLLALAYERGCSQSEISEQMNMPLGSVKSHLRRALATMKTTLELTCLSNPEHRR